MKKTGLQLSMSIFYIKIYEKNKQYLQNIIKSKTKNATAIKQQIQQQHSVHYYHLVQSQQILPQFYCKGRFFFCFQYVKALASISSRIS